VIEKNPCLENDGPFVCELEYEEKKEGKKRKKERSVIGFQ
jgi:hypothetical protein